MTRVVAVAAVLLFYICASSCVMSLFYVLAGHTHRRTVGRNARLDEPAVGREGGRMNALGREKRGEEGDGPGPNLSPLLLFLPGY